MTASAHSSIDSELLRSLRSKLVGEAPLEALGWFRDAYAAKHGRAPDWIPIVIHLKSAMLGISLTDSLFLASWKGFGAGAVSDGDAEAKLMEFVHLVSSV